MRLQHSSLPQISGVGFSRCLVALQITDVRSLPTSQLSGSHTHPRETGNAGGTLGRPKFLRPLTLPELDFVITLPLHLAGSFIHRSFYARSEALREAEGRND